MSFLASKSVKCKGWCIINPWQDPVKTLDQIHSIVDLDSRVINAAALLEAELQQRVKEEGLSLGELVSRHAGQGREPIALFRAIAVRNQIAHPKEGQEPTNLQKIEAADAMLEAVRNLRGQIKSPAPRRNGLTGDTARALAAREELIKSKGRGMRQYGLIGILGVLVAGVPIILVLPKSEQIIGFGVLGAVTLLLAKLAWGSKPDLDLREGEYYRLPGARCENGDHRCIYCGNRAKPGRGIYIHGDYGSSRKSHDCSKCKKLLFVS